MSIKKKIFMSYSYSERKETYKRQKDQFKNILNGDIYIHIYIKFKQLKKNNKFNNRFQFKFKY